MKEFDEFRFNRLEERAWESERILAVWQKAQDGDAEAQYELGCYYIVVDAAGNIVLTRDTKKAGFLNPDNAKAAEWLGKAAEQGHEGAKKKLAELGIATS